MLTLAHPICKPGSDFLSVFYVPFTFLKVFSQPLWTLNYTYHHCVLGLQMPIRLSAMTSGELPTTKCSSVLTPVDVCSW